jgi:anti-sigma regulatory factor (Ser/Thr protein kinase)
MTPGRRRLVALAGISLALVVVVACLAMLAVVALPLALGLGLTICTLVVALGTRPGRRPGSRRTARTPARPDHRRRADVLGPRPTSPLRWATRWESAPTPDAVPVIRGRATVVLAEWGLVGEAVEPALLVVTELLSNAVDHGRGPVRLAVEYAGEWVHIEVHDGAPEPPQLQPRDLLQRRGRGLQLVEALSRQWGWTDDPPGKLVWADVPTEWPPSATTDTATW